MYYEVIFLQKHFFIAIPLENDDKQFLQGKTEVLKKELQFNRWTHKEDLHITLAFLGASDKERLKDCMNDLEASVRHYGAFSLQLTKFGTFGKKESPRIFWCAPKAEEKLMALQKEVAEKCRKHGYELDQRPYKPHITMARKYSGESVFSSITIDRANQLLEKPHFLTVNRIVLFETKLDEVPKYHELWSIYL